MNRILSFLLITAGLFTVMPENLAAEADPVRIGIVGLSHGHARLVFRHLTTEKVVIVGIAETDPVLRERFQVQFNLPEDLFYNNLTEMLQQAEPEAVAVFTSTFEHPEVVEICAPRGIHVMVEKPLAVNSEHASRIETLVREYKIHVITNYETTWHPALEVLRDSVFVHNRIGKPVKLVFHHGNKGAVRGRGVDEFIDWLTDPVRNGGGAVIDFGCYGININELLPCRDAFVEFSLLGKFLRPLVILACE